MPSSQDTPPNAFWPEPQYRSRSATALALIAGALAVLTLPYLLPMSPVDSDSYFVGFSNRGALVLLLLFLGGFGYWHGPVGRGHPQPETASQKVVSLRKPLVALFACTLVAGIWELAVQHQLGPRQEGLYFFDRLSKLAEGQRMYRDFELAYGALLLYLPVGMHRVLGTSYLTSYSLSLLAQNLIGLGFLGYSVRVVARNCSRKGGILVLFAVTALGWTPLAGAQYTSLRYWSGPAIALFSYQCFQQGHRVRAAIALLAGLAFTLVISPEQSIALILGCCLFAGLFLRCSWPRLLPALAFLTLAEALLLFAAYKLRALDTVLAMGSGAYAGPIVPTPAFLATLAVLAIAACTLVEAIRTQAQGTPELLLLCISLWLLPVAFAVVMPSTCFPTPPQRHLWRGAYFRVRKIFGGSSFGRTFFRYVFTQHSLAMCIARSSMQYNNDLSGYLSLAGRACPSFTHRGLQRHPHGLNPHQPFSREMAATMA